MAAYPCRPVELTGTMSTRMLRLWRGEPKAPDDAIGGEGPAAGPPAEPPWRRDRGTRW